MHYVLNSTSLISSQDMHPLSLDYMVAPRSRSSFLAESWGKVAFFLHRNNPDYYESLFTLNDLDRCLAIGIGNPRIIVSFVPPPGSSRAATEGPITNQTRDAAYRRFASGDTIRVIGIDKLWPPAMELALRLREALGVKVGINSYLTPASSQGFSVHFDYHDAFIVQVSGRKRWFVYEPIRVFPVDLPFAKVWDATSTEESDLTPIMEEVLETGDLLYIPRGFYHKALTMKGGHSLHLTVSLNPVYWVSVVQRALEQLCVELPELRQALPPDFPAGRRENQELVNTFGSLLQLVARHANFDKAAWSILSDDFDIPIHPPDGHFRDLVELEAISLATIIEKRAGLIPVVEIRGENAVVQFGANFLQCPGAILTALEFVRDHDSFRVTDLPVSLSDHSKIVLVRRLVREGLLRICGSGGS